MTLHFLVRADIAHFYPPLKEDISWCTSRSINKNERQSDEAFVKSGVSAIER